MNAIIANKWIRECEDLTGKGWIGQGFLIPHHTRCEHQFTFSVLLSSKQCACVASAVGRQKDARPTRT